LRSGSKSNAAKSWHPNLFINILQAFIILFLAAPAIIRTIYRLKQPSTKDAVIASTSLSEKK
jgi:simple sugar transport system permease protein